MKSVPSTIKHRDDELFKTLSEELPVGVCIMQDGRFCYVNNTFPIAIGYAVDELVGKDSLEIVVPEDRETVKENTMKMLKGQLRSPYQFRVTGKDGSIVWVMGTVKPIEYRGRPAVLGNYMEVTGRKRIEEALQAEKNKLEALIGAMEDYLTIRDRDYNLTYVSERLMNLWGDRTGEKCYRVFAGEEKVCEGCPAEQAFRDGKSHTAERKTVLPSGRIVIREITANPIRDAEGKTISCLEVSRDITERKQTEELRRETEEQKSALLEEAPVSVIHTDLQGRVTYVNKRFELESGYSRDEIIGKDGLQQGWFSADTKKYFAERMAARLIGSPAKHWETQFKRKDGRSIWIELEGKILAKLGIPFGFQIIAGNITERKQTEEALKQSEQKYRTILDEMGDGYFETDIAGNFTFVNDAMIRLLGYSKEEIIGTNFRAFTPEEKVKTVFEAYNRMYRTGEPLCDFPTEVIRKDGQHRFAETTALPIRNDKGEIIGFRGIRRDITARKQMEEALKESEERYRTILEEMEDSYFEVDLGGHLTFVNNSVCRDLGYSREELIGRSYKSFTVEEDTEPLFRVFNEVYRTTVPNKGFPWRTVRKDGSLGFAETSISLLRNGKGEIVGFRGVGRDISGRKEAEAKLRQSEERYRALFDNSVAGTLVVDAETMKVLIGNQAAARMFGFGSAEQGVGADILDFVPTEEKEIALGLIKKELFEQDSRRTFDLPAVTKDGRAIWISATGARITHGNRLAGLLSFADITERKLAEERLRQSEENYRVLFDSSVIGTIVVDAETTRVVMANQAAAKMFGFASVEETIGADPLEFIHPEDRDEVLRLAREGFLEQNSHQTYDLRATTKNSREIWMSATGARIMHEGRLAGLISFADITDQKLQSEKLIMTDRLASLGELASGAAHELNNPLTSIIGFSQLLMEREVPDDIREDLKLINSEAQRAASVTRNLLTFGGKHAPLKEPNQINNIVDDVLRLRTHEHKANGIEIEKHLAPGLPEVMVDYFQMQQVFMNIIINAEYFMKNAHNRGTLTITTKEQNDTVMVIFTDDGPGIPSENLRRIFDPFFTTKEEGKGTGLGLSICHGIVTEHGGQIYATSQLGKGATIVVELPVKSERRD